MTQFSFERLEVWQDARVLAKNIYIITKSYPEEEKYCLVSQMRRSAVSVASNIVEGSYRNSVKDKYNFMNIAFGSLMELLNQTIISLDLKYITDVEYGEIRALIEKVSNKLASLANYFRKKQNPTKSQNNEITK